MGIDIEKIITGLIPKIEHDLVEELKSAPFSKLLRADPPISRLCVVPMDFHASATRVRDDLLEAIARFHTFMREVAQEAGTVNLEPSVSVRNDPMSGISEILLGVRTT